MHGCSYQRLMLIYCRLAGSHHSECSPSGAALRYSSRGIFPMASQTLARSESIAAFIAERNVRGSASVGRGVPRAGERDAISGMRHGGQYADPTV